MRTCDLCEEFSMADVHCDQCGQRMEPLPPPAPIPDPPPNRFQPIEAVAAPLRARHGETLGALAEWALAEGRGYGRAAAALCVDVLASHVGADGEPLDRRQVNRIVYGGVRNRATLAGTQLPDGWMSDLWTVLRFLADTGRLAPGSDPEPALVEPLQCYGGLGADGRPRPDGVDVDFPCQCHLPHDPTCPPGMAQHIIGHDRDDGFEFVVHAHVLPRSVDVPMSGFRPLSKLARRTRARHSMFPIALDQFIHVGTIPASKEAPQLWIYLFAPKVRRGYPPLLLDEHGNAFRAKRHRGRRRGFRWETVDDYTTAHWCGLAEWVFERPEPGTIIWDDEHDEASDPARA